MEHIPVLETEIVKNTPGQAQRIVDATLGAGGHARSMLVKAPKAELLGIDQDERMLAVAQKALQDVSDRVNLMRGNFREIKEAAADIDWVWADVILFDLGLASPQLADPAYGLSFQTSGPLDMRLDRAQALTASTIVNTWKEADLVKLLQELGQEPFAARIAHRIVSARRKTPIATTEKLMRIVEEAVPARVRYKRSIHPATNPFRALRMAVNDELGALEEALPKAIELLSPGSVLMVISFHSLEDRIVKQAFKSNQLLSVMTKKPITPSEEEIAANPRSRSAKLRIVLKRE